MGRDVVEPWPQRPLRLLPCASEGLDPSSGDAVPERQCLPGGPVEDFLTVAMEVGAVPFGRGLEKSQVGRRVAVPPLHITEKLYDWFHVIPRAQPISDMVLHEDPPWAARQARIGRIDVWCSEFAPARVRHRPAFGCPEIGADRERRGFVLALVAASVDKNQGFVVGTFVVEDPGQQVRLHSVFCSASGV